MKNTTRTWILIAGAWTLWGLLWSGQVVASNRLQGQSISFHTALAVQMPLAFGWLMATPIVLWIKERFPFDKRRWPVSVVVHVACCLVILSLLDFLYVANFQWVVGPRPDAPPLLQRAATMFVQWIVADGLIYWAVLSVAYGIDHYRKFREREFRATQLEAQLATARLDALKMQLQPHFLFNALNTIGSLVRTGRNTVAVNVVARLGRLLRWVLDEATTHEVALKDELAFVRNYLEIERVRFSDRLDVTIAVDSAVLEASVPHLILQPLVENAIKHGIGPNVNSGTITIGAVRSNGELQLTVRDNGCGISDNAQGDVQTGVGLANTQARLTQLYGSHARLAVHNGTGGGTEVTVALPYRAHVPSEELE